MAIDARRFVNSRAPFLHDKIDDVCRAAHVAKHIRFYEQIARGYNRDGSSPPITLTREEKEALVREKDKIISERGMWFVFITISLAAFLQVRDIPHTPVPSGMAPTEPRRVLFRAASRAPMCTRGIGGA